MRTGRDTVAARGSTNPAGAWIVAVAGSGGVRYHHGSRAFTPARRQLSRA